MLRGLDEVSEVDLRDSLHRGDILRRTSAKTWKNRSEDSKCVRTGAFRGAKCFAAK